MTVANRASIFAALPPHKLVRNAFGPEMVAQLLVYAAQHETEFTDAKVGARAASFVNPSVRRSRATKNLGDLRPALDAKFTAVLDMAVSALGLTPFEIADLSVELVAHGDGDFYQRHIDTFTGDHRSTVDRVLTAVYYFYAEPKAFEGGELRLFSLLSVEKGGTYTDLMPLNDSLLLFPAWVPHEVRPVSCPGGSFMQSRFAINCWYNRRQ